MRRLPRFTRGPWRKRFAWLPTCVGDATVWLRPYYSIEVWVGEYDQTRNWLPFNAAVDSLWVRIDGYGQRIPGAEPVPLADLVNNDCAPGVGHGPMMAQVG